MSSGVPPSPPVTTTTSTTGAWPRSTTTIASRSSGTDAISCTGCPSASSRRASHDAFVFSVWPLTSSLPIVTIAAVTPPIYRRTMEIRELRDEDVAGVVRLLTAGSPLQLLSEEAFRHRLGSEPPDARDRRWVALDDGAVV